MTMVPEDRKIKPIFLDLKKGRQVMSLPLSRDDSTYHLRFDNLQVFLGLSLPLLVKSTISHTQNGFTNCQSLVYMLLIHFNCIWFCSITLTSKELVTRIDEVCLSFYSYGVFEPWFAVRLLSDMNYIYNCQNSATQENFVS